MMITVQPVCDDPQVPPADLIRRWAAAAYAATNETAANPQLTVRLVGEPESRDLNLRYRQRDGATNVLSFVFEDPPGVDSGILGDIVVCAPVVRREAESQDKSPQAHWAHMIVHGVLHLCGYDHQNESQAGVMEALERRVLSSLGFAEPYPDQK